MYIAKEMKWREPAKTLPKTGIAGTVKSGKGEGGFVTLDLKFDDDAIAACASRYGLDTLTGIMIPDESGPKITAKKKWTLTFSRSFLSEDIRHELEQNDAVVIAGKLNVKTKKIQLVW